MRSPQLRGLIKMLREQGVTHYKHGGKDAFEITISARAAMVTPQPAPGATLPRPLLSDDRDARAAAEAERMGMSVGDYLDLTAHLVS